MSLLPPLCRPHHDTSLQMCQSTMRNQKERERERERERDREGERERGREGGLHTEVLGPVGYNFVDGKHLFLFRLNSLVGKVSRCCWEWKRFLLLPTRERERERERREREEREGRRESASARR